MAQCPIWLGDPAVNMVSLAYDKYTEFATESYKLATDTIDDLDNYQLAPVSFNVAWNFDERIYGYQRPTAPAVPTDLDFRSPGTLPAPPAAGLTPVAFDVAPAAPDNPVPAVRDYDEPAPLTAVAPDGDVELTPVPTPVRPDMPLPAVPTLRDLDLPDVPDIVLAPFAGERPNTDLEPPLEGFAFTPEQYTSNLLDRVKGRVDTMLDGGTGLPAAVAQALRDRAYSALDVSERRAIQTATDEFASKGWEEPNGLLAERLAEVRQNNQNQRNALSRDIYIRDEELAIQNLQFAVTQGIALESALMGDHLEFMRLGLSAAQVAQEFRIRVFDARVSLANLGLQAYQVDAQVWRDQLQGELMKLEVYKAELEGAKARGELNEQDVRIYAQRIEAVSALADVYRADVEAAKAVAEQNKTLVDVERGRIQAYAERVGAYKVEWDAFASKQQSNTIRVQRYGLVEQGYSTRVGAWAQTQNQKLEQQRLHIAEADQQLRAWEGGLHKMLADIDAEKARLAAVTGAFGSRVALFGAQAAVETAASDANLRAMTVGIEKEKARTGTALENARLAVNQLLEVNRLAIAKLQGIAQTSSQLAAASMSAVSFSAGVASRRSESQSCDTNFSYSGSLDDSTPPT